MKPDPTWIILPAERIQVPISWYSKPGWFGQRYWIKWTDGKYRRCSKETIINYGTGD